MTLIQNLYQMMIMAASCILVTSHYQYIDGDYVGAFINGFEIQVHIKLEKVL